MACLHWTWEQEEGTHNSKTRPQREEETAVWVCGKMQHQIPAGLAEYSGVQLISRPRCEESTGVSPLCYSLSLLEMTDYDELRIITEPAGFFWNSYIKDTVGKLKTKNATLNYTILLKDWEQKDFFFWYIN